MKKLVELPTEFEGRGEVKGWKFKQMKSSPNAYLYVRSHPNCIVVYYEVFTRKMFKPDNREIYPAKKSFGKWAWCTTSREFALEQFDKIS